ncbi:MAG: nuclear transport factor 2 family protein [Candidatus Nanohalobium sp.]
MTRDIQKWLNQFGKNWKDRDPKSVLELFSENVEYHEIPTQKLQNKEEIRKEWQGIHKQKDINLDFEVYSGDENKYTVKWHLEYTQNFERKVLNGIYLIELDEENRCTEFWQYCQLEQLVVS